MGRHSRHYNDLNPLEGGGSGGGSGGRYKSSPRKSYNPDSEAEKIIGVGFGAPLAAAGTMAMIGKADRTATKASDEKRDQEQREAKDEIKRESRGQGLSAKEQQMVQEAEDEEDYQKRKTAPTTKTEMGKVFAKGGMTASSRADGCAVKGKTKGRFV